MVERKKINKWEKDTQQVFRFIIIFFCFSARYSLKQKNDWLAYSFIQIIFDLYYNKWDKDADKNIIWDTAVSAHNA